MKEFKQWYDSPQALNPRKLFFYHWRVFLEYPYLKDLSLTTIRHVISSKTHMFKEAFDQSFHSKILIMLSKIKGDLIASKKLTTKMLEHKVTCCKRIGIIVMNIPCNPKNRETQIQILFQIQEIQEHFLKSQIKGQKKK